MVRFDSKRGTLVRTERDDGDFTIWNADCLRFAALTVDSDCDGRCRRPRLPGGIHRALHDDSGSEPDEAVAVKHGGSHGGLVASQVAEGRYQESCINSKLNRAEAFSGW